MAKKEKYDVIVVGAGPGGITCAALLAKRGLNVLVLDKNERVGGKQMTVSMRGIQGRALAYGWAACEGRRMARSLSRSRDRVQVPG